MPDSFPYKDSHLVPWKYDVTLISTRTWKEEVCSNVSSGLSELTRSGWCYTPEEQEKRRKEIGKGTAELVRNRVTTEELLKIIWKADYGVIQQLNKSPALISILALLLYFEVHHETLLKETHVPISITDSSYENMVSLVLATNQVSFLDDELPPDWKNHTLAINIVVKCEDTIVVRVLINNGLALNFCSMASLKHLKVDMSLIRLSSMIIRAFGSTRHEVQEEIKLKIEIGPRSFMVNFQVIKVDSPCNMLLGRPWLHTTSAVAYA